MKKKAILKKFMVICMMAVIGITAAPVTCLAKAPTVDTKASALTVGGNQLKIKNFEEYYDTMLGSFVAPEAGKYTFKVTNNGSDSLKCHILNKNRAQIDESNWIDSTEYCSFTNMSLKKNEKIYFYIEGLYDMDLLAAKIDIKKVSSAKASPKLNKTATSLKVKHKTTLKLNNNKNKVIWVSSNKKIATVSSKGVVTAKSKGIAYVYAIANHKLYKCKISAYK